MEILSDAELDARLKDSCRGVEEIRRTGRFTCTGVDSVAFYKMLRELKMLRNISRAMVESAFEMPWLLPLDEFRKIQEYLEFLNREYKSLEVEKVPEMSSCRGLRD